MNNGFQDWNQKMSDGNPREMENKQVNSMIPPTTDLREFLDLDGGESDHKQSSENSLRPS